MLRFSGAIIALIVLPAGYGAGGAIQKPKPANHPALAYSFKYPGTYVYSVTVTSEAEGSKRSLAGPVEVAAEPAEDGVRALTVRAKLSERSVSGDSQGNEAPAVRPFRLFRTFRDGVETLKVDRFGTVVQSSGENSLPSTFGDVARLLLTPLPPGGQAEWAASMDGSVAVDDGANGKAYLPAHEKLACSLVEATAGAVTVKMRYDLSTRKTVAGKPELQLTGQGQTVFDTAIGAAREVSFRGTLSDSASLPMVATSLVVTCKLLTGQAKADALDELGRKPQDVAVERPIRDPALIQLLNDLHSNDKFKRKGAADKLSEWIPNENRLQVARALVTAANDSDLFVRWGAVKALGVWNTDEGILTLIRKLEDPEHAVRWATMDALGPLKDRRAAMPLALMVAQGRDRDFAAKALTTMGPVAEEVAIKLLAADAWEARLAACKMLQQWGSGEASAMLKLHAAKDENGIVKMAAVEALRAVGTRQ